MGNSLSEADTAVLPALPQQQIVRVADGEVYRVYLYRDIQGLGFRG